MSLMFINQIAMSLTFNNFEVRYPGNSHLAKEKVAKYITIYSISQFCPVYCIVYPDGMVNVMCTVGTLKGIDTYTHTNIQRKLIWPQSDPPKNLLVNILSLSFHKCLHV